MENHLDTNQNFASVIGAKRDFNIEKDCSIMKMSVLTIQFLLMRLEN